jgi:hypothetical protein
MKKVLILCILLLFAALLLTAGCKKTEKTGPSREDTSQTAPKEPAPVPLGPPKY